MEFCQRYSRHFVRSGMNSVKHATHYVSGLLGTQRRKNIETIEDDVSGSDYQGMEQFISSSPWSHREVMDDVARDANELLGDCEEAGFYIDESSFLKKGNASVGVQRQWSGRAGKVENCQVGVFGCLGKADRYAITDFRLYLPKGWAEDPVRCHKARVPEENQVYRPKWQQALDMVAHARSLGLEFGFVGCDSLYGSNALFTNALEDAGESHYTIKIFRYFGELNQVSIPAISSRNCSGFDSSRRMSSNPLRKVLFLFCFLVDFSFALSSHPQP